MQMHKESLVQHDEARKNAKTGTKIVVNQKWQMTMDGMVMILSLMFCSRMVRNKTKVCNSERKKTATCSWRKKRHAYIW
jgi:hypothetical protein